MAQRRRGVLCKEAMSDLEFCFDKYLFFGVNRIEDKFKHRLTAPISLPDQTLHKRQFFLCALKLRMLRS
jgi:hypothetical protein